MKKQYLRDMALLAVSSTLLLASTFASAGQLNPAAETAAATNVEVSSFPMQSQSGGENTKGSGVFSGQRQGGGGATALNSGNIAWGLRSTGTDSSCCLQATNTGTLSGTQIPTGQSMDNSGGIISNSTNQGTITGGTLSGAITNTLGTISNATNQGTIAGGTLSGTITNTLGTIANAANQGTITGGTLSGTIANTGTLQDIRLAPGARIDGGTISGSLAASSTATVANALLDVSNVPAGVVIVQGCMVTLRTVASNPGLDLTTAVTNADDGRINPDSPLLQSASGPGESVATLFGTATRSVLSDTSLAVSTAADGTMLIRANSLGGTIVPLVPEQVLTTTGVNGLEVLSTGGIRTTQNGIAITLAPTAYDATSWGSLGLDIENHAGGVMVVTLSPSTLLAARFDLLAVPGPAAASQNLQVGVEGDSTQPESFRYTVTYPDGTLQRLQPSLHDPAAFSTAMQDFGLSYTMNSSSITELLDGSGQVLLRFVPSYQFEPPPSGTTATSFLPSGDVNGDGHADYHMITPAGKQLLYFLP